jgi:hypothetical protein
MRIPPKDASFSTRLGKASTTKDAGFLAGERISSQYLTRHTIEFSIFTERIEKPTFLPGGRNPKRAGIMPRFRESPLRRKNR